MSSDKLLSLIQKIFVIIIIIKKRKTYSNKIYIKIKIKNKPF